MKTQDPRVALENLTDQLTYAVSRANGRTTITAVDISILNAALEALKNIK